MEVIVALIFGALMHGHTTDQIQDINDDLVYAQTEIINLTYDLEDHITEQNDYLAELSKRIEDNHIDLGTMQAGDHARIALIEDEMKDFKIRQDSLRQQLINLREYVTTD